MTITDQQSRAVAFLLHEIRPDWGVTSLLSLIGKHPDVDLGPLIIAATTKALDVSCVTPAPIFREGNHWPARVAAINLPKAEPCAQHVGQDAHNCRSCHADIKAGDRPQSMLGKLWNPQETGESGVK